MDIPRLILSAVLISANIVTTSVNLQSQNLIGLQVESGQNVWFGDTNAIHDPKFYWLSDSAAFRCGFDHSLNPAELSYGSVAIGARSGFLGRYSTALGSTNTAGGRYNLLIGQVNFSSAEAAMAFGGYLRLSRPNQVVVGSFNISNLSSLSASDLDPLFTVANGQFEARSDAFRVLRNALVQLGPTSWMQDDSMSVVMADPGAEADLVISSNRDVRIRLDADGQGSQGFFGVLDDGTSQNFLVSNEGMVIVNGVIVHNPPFRLSPTPTFSEYKANLLKLKISKWNYRGRIGPHIGPMAQSFGHIYEADSSKKSIDTNLVDEVIWTGIELINNHLDLLEKELEDIAKDSHDW